MYNDAQLSSSVITQPNAGWFHFGTACDDSFVTCAVIKFIKVNCWEIIYIINIKKLNYHVDIPTV